MKTVLVTGSEGNIGKYLVAALRLQDPSCEVIRVKNGAGQPRFDPDRGYYVGDLREPQVLDLIFRDHAVDHVIHAASTSYSHAGYKAHPFAVLHNDCAITLNVLEHSAGVRKFVFLSSALAYEHAQDTVLTEDMTSRLPAPTSSYGVAKYLGEQAVVQAHLERGTNYTIWRPFNVVSPLEPTEGEGRHVFVDFFRRIFVERVKEFNVFGSGRQVRCFIWVEEAAECIAAALEKPETDNQIINLARDEPLSLIQLKDLFLSIGKEMGHLPLDYDPPVLLSGSFAGVEMDVRIPSTHRLKELARWESSTTVDDCFRRFAAIKLQSSSAALDGTRGLSVPES